MKRATTVGGAVAAVLVLLAVALYRAGGPRGGPGAPAPPARPAETVAVPERSEMPAGAAAVGSAAESWQGFLYGRVTTTGGATHEGRLRFGGDQEAFWSDYFNGFKDENPWAALVPPERLPVERRPIEIFGRVLALRERPANLGRPFRARFGEIARIEARGGDVRVTLKSGAVFDLDRFGASDFDDGLRIWDSRGGVLDLDSLEVRAIELLPHPEPPSTGAAPLRLHGTVRTRQGDFTGFVHWNREAGLGSDELDGDSAGGKLRLRFDSIRSIARRPPASALVTLLDGREIVLSGRSLAGEGHRGIYVDDRRYGRVLVAWEACERVDFSAGREAGAETSGPAYGDFPPGQPLAGSVTLRDGRRLAGRLVYDLDESTTTETLDAPFQGIDYALPFGLVAAIAPDPPGPADPGDEPGVAQARVTLQDGEQLLLERDGDLGPGNAGLLIFLDGTPQPDYVPWSEVERVEFDRPPAVDPVLGGL